MRTINRNTAITVATLALLGAVAGTASAATATPSPSASSTTKATAAPTPKASTSATPLIGSNPGTWTPVTVTKKQSGKTISLVKDQAVIFKGYIPRAKFTSSDTKVFVTSNAKGTVGHLTANAGGHATGSGTAKVTVKLGVKVVGTYTIIVK
jgi:hypothetical protein